MPPQPLPANPLRIFVLNDHQAFLQALERFLDQEPDLMVIGKGNAAPHRLEPVIQARPDVVIVDPEIHDFEVGEIVRKLRSGLAGSRIIVLTMNDDEKFKHASLAAGADDFILKTNATDQLVPSIRQARHTP